MKVHIITTVRVSDESGAGFTVTEEQVTSTGGNPRYVADYAGAAMTDVGGRVHTVLEDRFGVRPDQGSGAGYDPTRPQSGRFPMPAKPSGA